MCDRVIATYGVLALAGVSSGCVNTHFMTPLWKEINQEIKMLGNQDKIRVDLTNASNEENIIYLLLLISSQRMFARN